MLNQLQPMLMQAHGRKRGRKVKPRPIYVSRKIEVRYTKALLTIVDDMHSETVGRLMPFATLQMGDGKMAVADGHLDGLLFVFDELKAFITGRVATVANGIATKIVDAQKQASDEQLADLLKKQTGIDLMGLMGDEDLKQAVDEAIYANVSLIKSIPKEYFDRVEKAVMASLQGGTLYQDLVDELGRIHAIGQNRARLIATDQLGKINSRLSQVRQQALGISHYTWSTSQDERVRHEHVLRDGRRFAWDNPPAGGHPGQAIRCRCVAVPDTSHLFGGVKTVDFTGLMVDKKEIQRLLVDLLDNKPKLSEAMVGAEYQSYFGVTLTRPSPEYHADGTPKAGFDYWVDGKQKLDFMFAMYGYDQFKIDKFNEYFAKNDFFWQKQVNDIQKHLMKADIVPLDLRYLADKNISKVQDYVLSLPQEQQNRLILITGTL